MCRLKAFVFILFSAFYGSTSFACDDAPTTLGLRSAIYAGDVEDVETSFQRTQAQFVEGRRSADEMRCLFRHFQRSRPETTTFIDTWLESYPASPFAQTAKAWNLYQSSLDMRGTGPDEEIYSEAAHLAETWMQDGWDLASRAYAANPRLIAASDVLILSAHAVGAQTRGDAVFAEVMANAPNYGSYERARAQHSAGRGHTWEEVERFCDTYAATFIEEGSDPALVCRLKVSPAFPRKRLWRIGQLKALDRPDLDYLWLTYLTRPEASADHAARAHAVMTADDYRDNTFAPRFDSHLAEKHGYGYVLPGITARRVAHAEKLLPHDPYNPVLIKWRLEAMSAPLPLDWQTFQLRLSSPSPAEAEELTKRLVIRAPFDRQAWAYYRWALTMSHGRLPHGLNMAFHNNLVVLGDHRMDDLKEYLGHLYIAFHEFPKYSGENAVYGPGDTSAQYAGYFDGVDRDSEILCPYVRGMRLWEHLCDTREGGNCHLSGYVTGRYLQVTEEVEARDICIPERTMPQEALFLSPALLPEID